MSLIAPFMTEVLSQSATGIAREHAYRPALAALLQSLDPEIKPVNDAARSVGGAPDYTLLKDDIAIGHLEAKDVNLGLRQMNPQNTAQQKRYLEFYDNLIYTNCLDWDFYRKGSLYATVTIGDFALGITPRPDKYAELENLLRDFVTQRPQTISTPRDLAERMAQKARMFKDALTNTLADDPAYTSVIGGHYRAFQHHLIHDISPADFADIYAETIAYGMFAARLHDPTPDTFSRAEAMDLLPKSNPFLRDLFKLISQQDLDDRIRWAVDDLASVFRAANIPKVMAGFGKLTAQNDPFLHFYETFLGAYDPKKRKARGVWYTPEPVVNFIVRAVDDVLRDEFGLADGLAHTGKVTVDWDTGQTHNAKPVTVKRDMHRVQILDPATGTGTFLAEVIKHIAPRIKSVGSAAWPTYIEQNLIPRLHGFELLMAAYAMCHLKLDMILQGLGYVPTAKPPRMGVYLTNSLEQGERDNTDLFMAKWLSDEAHAASDIKRQTPIMCVIGNPPYSKSSSNKGTFATNLVEPYKADLDEVSLNSLSDDYVKFIALAERFIAANGKGVVGFITNNSFLDGVVHRKMRLHLRQTFDKIYVINLNGDSNKKQRTPEGKPDQSVFDIMQGVSIIVAVKKGANASLATVKVVDVWGKRQPKYDYLAENSLSTAQFADADFNGDYHFFASRDFSASKSYGRGFDLNSFFLNGKSGIAFRKDKLLLTGNYVRQDAATMVKDVATLAAENLFNKYDFNETSDWQLSEQRKHFYISSESDIVKICYRPLDFRWSFYPLDRVNKIIPRGDSRHGLMRNMLQSPNVALIAGRQKKSGEVSHYFVTDCPSEMKAGESTTKSYHFPLYTYDPVDQSRRINFDPTLFAKLQSRTQHHEHGMPDEVQVFDYIYGVLHCPAYRSTYAEFLKIDFPRIPWPKTPEQFWDIAAKGAALRALHLMQPAAIGAAPYPFEGAGDSVVVKPRLEGGHIWINDTQRFENAPDNAWEFYIGGYQPAQKWLKDRRGRALSFDDIRHYQNVLKILSETARIMQTIEMDL